MRRWLMLMSLALVLAACGGGDGGGGDPNSEHLVNWVRDPYSVIFRAEVVGGQSNENDYYRLNEVPPCTIYGDGRVVWTEERPTGGVPSVLFDFLTEEQISSFVLGLTVEGRFLTYTEEFPNQIPTSETPVYEKMTLFINDVTHVTDEFAEWPDRYYEQFLTQCRKLGATPRIFEPDGAWISAQTIEYDGTLASIYWEPEAAGLIINQIFASGEKRWIEGQIVRVLWKALHDNGLNTQFTEGDLTYNILLQVPGVTLDAPPAPAAGQ